MSDIKSMTGSANRIINTDLLNLNIDITSVNSRYLEIYLKMPDSIRHLESKLRTLCQEKLSRGKLDCYISFTLNLEQSLNVNEDTLKALTNALSKVKKALPEATVNALEVLNYPGVLRQSDNLQDLIDTAVLENFEKALEILIENRGTEGTKLKNAILCCLDKVKVLTDVVGKDLDRLVELERERLKLKLEGMQSQIALDPQRLEQEVVINAQRADVREEYDRLRAHIDEVKSVLNKGGLCGKRLDFLMQEFNRESNTLASKASNLELNRVAVDLKVLIEQMREQVQNIE